MHTEDAWAGWPIGRTAIIAEIGTNHGGNETVAWDMILSAHEHGADFVKLQSYVTEDFFHPDLPYYASTKSLELSFESQRKLFRRARSKGIELITTIYDSGSLDMVEELEPSAYKIASMDNDNLPLLRCVAARGRPVLLGCGMAELSEIQNAVDVMAKCGNEKLVLLHCVSDYPTNPEDLNLAMIKLMMGIFQCSVGLSDHSLGIYGAFVATSLGVKIIEKHFTTDRGLMEKVPDADHDISIEPSELKELRRYCEAVPVMMGRAPRKLTEGELEGKVNWKRGLYARRDIGPGEELNEDNVAFLRPVAAARVGQWDEVCGKKALRTIAKLSPISFKDLES